MDTSRGNPDPRLRRKRLLVRTVTAAAATATVLGGGAAAPAGAEPHPAETVAGTHAAVAFGPARTCARTVLGSMSKAQVAGQLVMMGIPSTSLPASSRAILQKRHIGSVVMLGNSKAGVKATRTVSDAAKAADRAAHLIVTADQEGGYVQRLQGRSFARIPSAVDQATMSDADLAAAWKRWGGALRHAGVDVDLAPVADVVPPSVGARNQPIYQLERGYGSSRKAVAPKVRAVVKGLAKAHVGSTVKHFPGLGRVTGNTDTADKVTDHDTTRHGSLPHSFDAGIDAGATMVMVSTAYYARIDGAHPAALSRKVVYTMLRQDRDYHGVVVSDDMNAKQMRGFSIDARTWGFVKASGDIVLIGDPAVADRMARHLTTLMSDPHKAPRLRHSAERVLTMKARLGVLPCS